MIDATPKPAATASHRRLEKAPVDAEFDKIYDGKFNLMESVGQQELEAVNMMERDSQINLLSDLVGEFKRTISDTQLHMKNKLLELDLFLKE